MLKDLNDIDQCFDKKGRCILLFLTSSPTEGHWCCLLRRNNHIEFFDPYGETPEEVMDNIPQQLLNQLDENQPYLTNLLRQCGLPVYYNTHGFQQDKNEVNTCGRWCVTRCLYDNKTLEQFYDVIKKSGMKPDDFVTGLTANWLKK
jgi:hypothetical protein